VKHATITIGKKRVAVMDLREQFPSTAEEENTMTTKKRDPDKDYAIWDYVMGLADERVLRNRQIDDLPAGVTRDDVEEWLFRAFNYGIWRVQNGDSLFDDEDI
jgi:hypothetical protein